MVVEPPIVLRHFNKDQESSKDVTTLDWNVRGVSDHFVIPCSASKAHLSL